MKQKDGYENVITSLRTANRDVENTARETVHSLNTQISSLSLELTQTQSELSSLQEEVIILRARNEQLSDSVKKTDSLTSQLESDRYKLQVAERRVKELEADLVNVEEFKNLSNVFQERLAKTTDLERDCERLTRDNKNLHGTIGNKLLLEEQVYDLKTRLVAQTTQTSNLVDLETKLRAIEEEIKQWKKLTEDLCPSATPQALRKYIDDLHKKHIVLACDANAAGLEKSTVSDQMQELQKQNEFHAKTNETLTTSLQNYKNALHRIHKKMSLIAKERDCFKNLLENYEKDMTMSSQMFDGHPDIELKSRLDIVEKSLAGYKEICATLEKELVVVRSMNGDLNGDIPSNSEQNQYLQKELEKMRLENGRLQRRKDELELMIEHDKVKEAYGMSNGKELKVLHLIHKRL